MLTEFRGLMLAAAVALASCGGGGSDSSPTAAYPVRALVNQTASVVAAPQFNVSFFWPDAGTADPAASVALQASYPGDVGIVTPNTKANGFADFDQWVAAASAHSNVKYFYVYDEVFWKGNVIAIGADEEGINAAARAAHAAGYLSTVTIMPNVVLAPDFKLQAPNDLDVIALDLYPQLVLDTSTHGCAYDANPYTTMLYCSVQKLRAQGYTGQIWYVPQAFEVTTQDHAQFLAQLKQQQETIAIAPSFGVTGIAPYGLYWTTGAPFKQGADSDFESMVDCHAGC
jgi:hypothetical protein